MLELLAGEAPAHEYEALTEARRRTGAGPDELAKLERAKQLGLSIRTLTERHHQREAGLSALVDTARDLATPHDVGTLLQVILRRARLLLAVDMAYIGMYEDDQRHFSVRASDGHTTALNIGLRLPSGTGLGHVVMTKPSPFWSPDYLADERIHHSGEVDHVVRAEGLHAILAVPLSRGARPFGTLYVAERKVRHFTTDEIALLSSLGDLAGVAIEKAELLDRSTALVGELERYAGQVEAGLRGAQELGDTQHRLMQLVLGDCDLDTLARAAGKELGAAVQVCAANGTILTTAGDMTGATGRPGAPDGPADPAESALVLATMDAHAAREPVALHGGGLWAVPISAGTGNLGTLLLRPDRPDAVQDERLLRLVAQVVAVQLLVESRRTAIAEGQVRDDFLGDLLASPQRPPHQLEQHARRLGIDLSKPHVLVVARPEGDARGKMAIWAASYAHRLSGLKSMHNGCAVLLLPGTDAGGAARAVSAELSPLLGHPVTVGSAGPMTGTVPVHHGFQEALRCLDAMTSLGVTGRSASVRELGFLGVLLSDNHDVEGFVDSAIGPVIDYDQQRFTDLTRTLETYFDAGGSPTNAAKKLHVHPNTVARRLERISELLGPEWQQPDRALEVQLALRVFRVRHSLRRPDRAAAEEGAGPAEGRET
ncbi:helix-turn-helix domain-containing protein [Streptomyces albireticuli]|uniref:Transcriptional regulator n=2 Tax=Streptomyces albireticuli TaxID=1940 RepID=A0A2A2DBK3_9ACTN|nr:GAF domain-containing protein [Streptomyces albireticuli]MCD9145512.1 helix-turn-helix domain-containing protein [Streptomyces albireticuli]MCD9165199.1 helix-turn-helix domain-containing protein [Streptomyces albireticuli]MCD9195728.1 helix-turn-helix domain-containing protein [Streptomyces albireticuli]PAU49863.1 transcriptional regulator [Streptomyces albireticuli]